MTRHAIAATALAAATVIALTGCSIGAISQSITNAVEGKEDVFSIEVGDCFNDDTGAVEEISSVKMPECTEEHDNEAYYIYDVSDDDFPSYDAAAIEEDAEYGCFSQFEQFVGASVEETSLHYSYFYPSAASWEQGDREILCLAYDLDGPISEPLGGKGPNYPYEG
ncbi:septum formation family protein [Salinibacterium sp. SYSU T00001]|uniref:septum formation family protein n=1 Tax=Homoserinimonas sedimenticola TaxID=2986805 RepID=UPI00223647E6|nr:septum formation family protein [Salinibacterium sedimenticola]MCW4386600.1 septum formation family protein [Salinibacterium sedimenticola]